jgi:hypothetical protein
MYHGCHAVRACLAKCTNLTTNLKRQTIQAARSSPSETVEHSCRVVAGDEAAWKPARLGYNVADVSSATAWGRALPSGVYAFFRNMFTATHCWHGCHLRSRKRSADRRQAEQPRELLVPVPGLDPGHVFSDDSPDDCIPSCLPAGISRSLAALTPSRSCTHRASTLLSITPSPSPPKGLNSSQPRCSFSGRGRNRNATRVRHERYIAMHEKQAGFK